MIRKDQGNNKKYLSKKTRRYSIKNDETPSIIEDKENLTQNYDKRIKKSIKSPQNNYFTCKIRKNIKINTSFADLPLCTTIHATDQDLENPISFFDSLWENKQISTGIIKIIPPKSWLSHNEKIFTDNYFKNFKESSDKLEISSQRLNELFLAKVSLFLIFIIICCIFTSFLIKNFKINFLV